LRRPELGVENCQVKLVEQIWSGFSQTLHAVLASSAWTSAAACLITHHATLASAPAATR
jgi:hypothetical protein